MSLPWSSLSVLFFFVAGTLAHHSPAAASSAAAEQTSFALNVRLSLSPKAAARLLSLHESVIVSASYSGEPAPGTESHADQIGRIDLGSESVPAPGRPGTVHIPGSTVPLAHLVWVRGPILLNVNVFSARHSGPDNILACDFFDGTLQNAQKKTVPLHCSLIAEGKPTQALS